jgi:hypothetical protein
MAFFADLSKEPFELQIQFSHLSPNKYLYWPSKWLWRIDPLFSRHFLGMFY